MANGTKTDWLGVFREGRALVVLLVGLGFWIGVQTTSMSSSLIQIQKDLNEIKQTNQETQESVNSLGERVIRLEEWKANQ